MICLGASLYEATLHGHESAVLPAVDRWRELTGFYPRFLPLWSPFDINAPAPRGGRFPPGWLLQGLRQRGVEPAVFAHSADQSRWATHGYAAILRGDHDESLERWGQKAAKYGHRMVFRWDQEMNGRFPWSKLPPAEYIAAFRHVSERIREIAGARNVKFFFCPSLRRDTDGLDLIEAYYPGDRWCQWVGFDAFSRQESWAPLADSWGPLLDRYRSMTENPVMVGEFGRRIDHLERDQWLRTLRDVRGVRAAVYFDMNLTHFDEPAHHWRMGRRMRRVYRQLPRCAPVHHELEEPEEPEEPTPSPPSDEPVELAPSPSAQPSPIV